MAEVKVVPPCETCGGTFLTADELYAHSCPGRVTHVLRPIAPENAVVVGDTIQRTNGKEYEVLAVENATGEWDGAWDITLKEQA